MIRNHSRHGSRFPVTSTSAPGAPTIGTATATGATTATVSFTQPASNGGSVITSYTATSSPSGITGVLNQAGSGTITVTGLASFTSYTFTVTATNAIGTSAPSAASNSITTTDAYWANVSMLLHGDGVNAAQNNTFLDGSTNNFTVTRNGNTTQGSFNPFVSTYPYAVATNGGSAYFDGTGDYLSVAALTSVAFGSNDFTVECWANIGQNAFQLLYDSRPGASPGAYVALYVYSGPSFALNVNASAVIQSSNVSLNVWYHVAISRVSGTTKMFVNGVQAGSSFADSTVYLNGLAAPSIGANGNGSQAFAGYISNVRAVNGTGLYTTTFTPPTAPLTAVTNTALLLGMSNGAIYDNAELNNLETVASAQISTSVFKYGTGALKFNGTTDYLPTPAKTALALGAGDFTIECWLYPTVTGLMRFMGQTDPGVSSYPIQLRTSATNTIVAQAVTSGGVYTATSTLIATANAWTHVAFVRDGTTIRIYIGGVQSGTNATIGTLALVSSTNAFSVGAFGEYASDFWSGYIDDVRITKGICRYPSGTTFTPPTAAFPNS